MTTMQAESQPEFDPSVSNGVDDDDGLADQADPGLTPRTPKERVEQQRVVATELNELFGDVNYATEKYKCTLMRHKPATDENGVDIQGWTWEGSEPLAQAEVEAQFGGGSWQWLVHGPDPRLGGKQGLLKNIRFKISGKPKPKHHEKEAATDAVLVQSALDSKEKDTQRLAKTYEAQIQALMDELKELRSAALKGNSNGPDVVEMMRLQLEAQKLEFAKQEAARKEEAEERRRAEDRRIAAEEKKEALRLAAEEKKDNERKAELARIESERKADLARLEREGGKASSELLTVMQQAAADREQASREFLTLIQNQNATAMQQAQAHSAQVLSLATKKNDGPFSGIMEAILVETIKEKFLGGGGKEKEEGGGIVSQLTQLAKENGGLPAILRGIGELRGVPPPAQPRQPVQPRVAPGSAAVVDLPHLPPAPRAIPRRAATPVAPAAPAKAPVVQPPVVVVPKEPQSASMDALANAPVVDVPASPTAEAPVQVLTEFSPSFPDAAMGQEETFIMLATNLEGALKAEWPTVRVWKEIVVKYPEPLRLLLASMTPEQIAVEVERNAPPDWTLNSPRGHKLILDLSAYLQFPM